MQNNPSDTFQSVLIASTDIGYGAVLDDFLSTNSCRIEHCHDAAGVLRLASRKNFDVIVLDLALTDSADVDLISFLRQRNVATRLILLFEMHRIEQALEGFRLGAFFYLPKSCPPSDVALAIEKALRNKSDEQNLDAYEQNVFEELVGHTDAMKRVITLIRKVAPTNSTVLLLGESGTGKEVLANTVHRLSRRREMPFIAINCAALPEALLESEMFGHVKGAFTGADSDKIGLFEEADGGTIFLDEIGDMAPITQAKLLRVLQSGDIRPVGASTIRHVDVRIIAATNRDLVEAVSQNTFREDLYFRLNTIQIRIPPLRERMDALPALLSHFLKQANAAYEKGIIGFDDHALTLLRHYEYPGNVRELESIVQHAVIMADGPLCHVSDLPEQVQQGTSPRLALPYQPPTDFLSLAQLEARHIDATLNRLNGNQTLAAKHLGISRSTLWRKMKEYGIPR